MPKTKLFAVACQETVKKSVTNEQFNNKQLFTETVRSRFHTCLVWFISQREAANTSSRFLSLKISRSAPGDA